MATDKQLIDQLAKELEGINASLAESRIILERMNSTLQRQPNSQLIPTTSRSPLKQAENPLSPDVPLREQLTFEGKPIPAPGSSAAELVAAARAAAAETKREFEECTDGE